MYGLVSVQIVDGERVLERMIIAARNSRKTREQRREESLRRVSAELTQLRKRMRKARIDSDSEDDDITPTQQVKQNRPCGAEINRMSQDEVREMLTISEFQSESSQTMYKVLIKLIGEVGPLEGNSRCLRQLSEFTTELRVQESKLFPKLELLRSVKEELDEEQIVRLERLKTWQQTQNKQVDGIEKLLTSLLEQGNIKWQRVSVMMNDTSNH
jgi:translation initiation factor 2 beta subunit (eIF-2beta)/eIF-5